MPSIKTDQDIADLREGGKRLAFIVDAVGKKVAPGVSINELNTCAQELFEQYQGDRPAFLNYKPSGARRAFPAAICVSVNSEIVHGIPTENPHVLQEGDLVTIDAGLVHKDLFTDHARTYAVGQISGAAGKLMKVTKESLARGIAAAKAGNTIGDIGHAIQSYVEEHKLTIIEGLAGHGVGYDVHEPPYVPNEGTPGTGEVLKQGMVLAIEPMVSTGGSKIVLADDNFTYLTADGSLSAQFEHTIAITDGDAEILTNL